MLYNGGFWLLFLLGVCGCLLCCKCLKAPGCLLFILRNFFDVCSLVTVNSWWFLDGCYLFLMLCGWLLIILGGLWMVAPNSWWLLHGYLFPVACAGWLLILGGFCMVASNS